MKPAHWHEHGVTGARIFGHELEAGDRTLPSDVYESDFWRPTVIAGEKLSSSAVARIRYVRPALTPAACLGITPGELGELVSAAVASGSPALAAVYEKLTAGGDAIAVHRGPR